MLRKLRGRSIAELRGRAVQLAAARLERVGVGGTRDLSDAELLGVLSKRTDRLDDLLERFRVRSTPRFFASFDDRAATVDALSHGWPEGRARVLERADAVREGRFDLLGHRGLSFGSPIDWQMDPVAKIHAPHVHWSRIDFLDPAVAGDHKLIWELNRHQHFLTLGRAYWLTADEGYARCFAEQIVGWMDANPAKIGVNWASSLEVALRSISWLWALHFFRDSPALTPALFARIVKVLYTQARHIERYLSTYFSPNTHLTGEALGLLYIGTLLPELADSGRWRVLGARILGDEIGRHVYDDGVYFEQATYYQRYTADFYLHALLLGRRNRVSLASGVAPRVESLLECLMYLTRPDGRTPLLGDDDGGRLVTLDERPVNDFRASLSTGALEFRRPDMAGVAGLAEESVWLLGASAVRDFASLGCEAPASTSRAFEVGGYFVMRDAWAPDAQYALIDCGPHGMRNCGHAHADALAIEVSAGGEAMLVDPGTYSYTTSTQDRDAFRGAAAHNALTLDGEGSSVPGGPFTWRRIATCRVRQWVSTTRVDLFEGSHDGFARLPSPAVHRRSLLFLRGSYWVMCDRIESAGEHEATIHVQAAAGVTMQPDGVRLSLRAPGGHELSLTTVSPGATVHVGEGWVSESYAHRERASHARIIVPTTGTQEIVTFLIPEHTTPGARLSASAGSFVVDHAGGRDALSIGPVSGPGAMCSDGQWTWVRRDRGGELEELVVVAGSELLVDGQRWQWGEGGVGGVGAGVAVAASAAG
ncbi:MAG: heparinase II/III family protein, partial [Gemmatimonadota bacterium]|nr:heparinase II/III family protein [Gemmatimonadota bacterium]